MATKTGDQWIYRAGVPAGLHERVQQYLAAHGVAESDAIRAALERLVRRPLSQAEIERAAVAMGRPRRNGD